MLSQISTTNRPPSLIPQKNVQRQGVTNEFFEKVLEQVMDPADPLKLQNPFSLNKLRLELKGITQIMGQDLNEKPFESKYLATLQKKSEDYLQEKSNATFQDNYEGLTNQWALYVRDNSETIKKKSAMETFMCLRKFEILLDAFSLKSATIEERLDCIKKGLDYRNESFF